jgi:hypothetical protein
MIKSLREGINSTILNRYVVMEHFKIIGNVTCMVIQNPGARFDEVVGKNLEQKT